MNVNLNREIATSQCGRIANYLKAGYSLTSLEALKLFGCMRLASRICDLRDRGYTINTCRVKTDTGKYITEYSMPS